MALKDGRVMGGAVGAYNAAPSAIVYAAVEGPSVSVMPPPMPH
jgi:hypothetical protein